MLLVFWRAFAACLISFIGIGAPLPARADGAPNPSGDLTLARAIDAALMTNPDLRTSAYELSAAQARVLQAGLRPNPEVGVELENFAGSREFAGVDALETTLSLSQVIELGGKRSLRRSAAEFDLEAVTIEQRARELDVLAEVTRRFIDVVVAQERVDFATQASALASNTVNAIDARVRAGRSPEAERSRARVAQTRAVIELRESENTLSSARYALAAAWGSTEPAFASARAHLFDLTQVDTLASLKDRIDQSPDFARFASLQRQRDAELRLARAQARPDLTFSLGVRRFEGTTGSALVAGFSMPVALFDKNQGGIREAEVRAGQTSAQHDAARVRAFSSLTSLYQDMSSARWRLETLRNDALPQAQLALDQTRSGFERGRFSFLELVSVQEELLALRSASIDAAAEYHRMLVEIERLSGAALTRQSP
jgi:cobalt-zinc-cadmium efflux system outer membrane protein